MLRLPREEVCACEVAPTSTEPRGARRSLGLCWLRYWMPWHRCFIKVQGSTAQLGNGHLATIVNGIWNRLLDHSRTRRMSSSLISFHPGLLNRVSGILLDHIDLVCILRAGRFVLAAPPTTCEDITNTITQRLLWDLQVKLEAAIGCMTLALRAFGDKACKACDSRACTTELLEQRFNMSCHAPERNQCCTSVKTRSPPHKPNQEIPLQI